MNRHSFCCIRISSWGNGLSSWAWGRPWCSAWAMVLGRAMGCGVWVSMGIGAVGRVRSESQVGAGSMVGDQVGVGRDVSMVGEV